MTEHERSPSGAPIFRHSRKDRPFRAAVGDHDALQAIDDHIERYLGPVDFVFHELASDVVHVDLHVVPPTEERPYLMIVTSGMSDLAMTVPDGAEELRYAELMIALPADWPLDPESLKNERHYWPLRALKFLARLPHEHDTWLAWGHTIPNGDPPVPFAPNTELCGLLLLAPTTTAREFCELRVNDEKTVYFYAVFPLLRDEMDFKLEHGTEALLPYFGEVGLTENLDIARRSVLPDER